MSALFGNLGDMMDPMDVKTSTSAYAVPETVDATASLRSPVRMMQSSSSSSSSSAALYEHMVSRGAQTDSYEMLEEESHRSVYSVILGERAQLSEMRETIADEERASMERIRNEELASVERLKKYETQQLNNLYAAEEASRGRLDHERARLDSDRTALRLERLQLQLQTRKNDELFRQRIIDLSVLATELSNHESSIREEKRRMARQRLNLDIALQQLQHFNRLSAAEIAARASPTKKKPESPLQTLQQSDASRTSPVYRNASSHSFSRAVRSYKIT